MTVTKKMILLMVSALLGICTLAGMAQYQMEQVYESANFGNANTVPSLINLSKAVHELSSLRVQTWQHIAQTDHAKMDALEQGMNESYRKIGEALNAYEKENVADEKDRQLLANVRAALADYMTVRTKAVELSRADRADAARELMGANQAIVHKLSEAVDEHGHYNTELGFKASTDAKEFKSHAITLAIVVAIITLVTVACIGFWVTRSIIKPLNETVAVANSIAHGDLTVQIEVDSKDELGQLKQSMQNMVAKLAQIIGEVRGSADALASASEEVSATAQSLSQSSTEQAASVEETTASIEQMTASVNQNTENAKVTDSMASKASSEAAEGGQAVRETVEAMQQIASRISIIDDIAYQTNLLALNAAIEAARAGEHGKGFAVVAAEVRKLAERSQIAAQEIGDLASNSVKQAERAGNLLGSMVPSIQKTSDLVQEIAAGSQEQSAGLAQINSAMNQLNSATQQNASASEELAATAEEMGGQSVSLQELMQFFTLADANRMPAARPQRPAENAPPSLRSVATMRPVAVAGGANFERF
jgi:methyl-accepting chemotaxis protein